MPKGKPKVGKNTVPTGLAVKAIRLYATTQLVQNIGRKFRPQKR
jgi:hypothetical protein